MKHKVVSLALKAVMAILPVTMLVTDASAGTYKVLYSFGPNRRVDGVRPYAGLIMDKSGNLYGTTRNGGPSDEGIVFELSPGPDGTWIEKVIYAFMGSHSTYPGGANPMCALVFDASGNLYGTTELGGDIENAGNNGVVFELSPAAGGTWTETVLHHFTGADGAYPEAGLVLDGAGNLYGTTSSYGPDDGGAVFELSLVDGVWTYKGLHNFGKGDGGSGPSSGLTIDEGGNLYGTTYNGGSHPSPFGYGSGTAYKLTANEDAWAITVLHNFGKGEDGFYPTGGVAFDGAGNLFGVTNQGGTQQPCGYGSCGTVFELTPQEAGGWKEEILHDFHTEGTGGENPVGGLIFDGKGNFYGTTEYGGADNSGELFEFSATEEGGEKDTVLHDFGHNLDGAFPQGTVFVDASGNIYGTTSGGGAHEYGTVFEYIP